MAINPDNITTIRVDQLADDTLGLTDKFPHTVGTELKSSTIQELVDLVAAAVGVGSGVGYLPISVTDGQQLPDVPTDPSFFLAGAGTYLNINGFPNLICTENLNAIMSLADHWEIAVEIPINPLSGTVQSVTGTAVDNTDPLNPIINLGGSTPTLQEVTDEGNETTNDIKIAGLYLYDSANDVYNRVYYNDGQFIIENNTTGFDAFFDTTSLTDTRFYTLPDGNGSLALLSDIPTPTPPQDIDDVLSEGNEALDKNLIFNETATNNSVSIQAQGIQATNTDLNFIANMTYEKIGVLFENPFITDNSTFLLFDRISRKFKDIVTSDEFKTDVIFEQPLVDADIIVKNESGTVALLSDIPTNTSDLVNDGENGTSPYVTADQLPSNLNLFATDVSSDIPTYFKLVTSISDPDYNTIPVDIPTGVITTTGQLIATLATTANVLVGNPGIINLLTIGNVRRTSGSGTAEFYYEVYHRTSGGTETLISTSSKTPPINTNVYTEFLAAALLNNGVFLATDRIVVKYYADRVGSGSNPNYDFQFGGISPVRTNFPVPATNIPLDAIPTDGSTNGVQSNGVFDALALRKRVYYENTSPSTAVTGTTSETQISGSAFTIPANTIPANSHFFILPTIFKTVGTNTTQLRLKVNTTNNYATATTIANFAIGGSNTFGGGHRKFIVNGGNIKGFSFTAGVISDIFGSGSGTSSASFPVTGDLYFFWSIQNNAIGDSATLESVQITS
jgi:hypothetical protein